MHFEPNTAKGAVDLLPLPSLQPSPPLKSDLSTLRIASVVHRKISAYNIRTEKSAVPRGKAALFL